MEKETDAVVVLEDPVPALGKLVKDKRGRAETKRKSQVDVEALAPGHAQEGPIVWVDGDQPVRVANVQFGEKSAAALVYYEIDGIVNARVRQRKLVTGDAVVDTLAGRMRQVDDQTPSARAASFGNNAEATDV